MRRAIPILVVSLGWAISVIALAPGRDAVLDDLVSASVTVELEEGFGSGVVFANGGRRFVWTNAHVVAPCLKKDKQGRSFFDDVTVSQQATADGRQGGGEYSSAKVIRYSDRHDLALLELARGDWPSKAATFVSAEYCPALGKGVWHVGSMFGARGANSVSLGVVASVGRLRDNGKPSSRGLAFDQVSIAAHPGCSGGGIFDRKSGRCIGLITEFLGPGNTPSAFCLTPARRMWEYARQADCLWAIDPKVAPGDGDPPFEAIVQH